MLLDGVEVSQSSDAVDVSGDGPYALDFFV
jgi:hypothetical protein